MVAVQDPKHWADSNLDVLFVFSTEELGYNSFKLSKEAKIIFINCEPPAFLNKKTKVAKLYIDPTNLVDTLAFPDTEPKKEYSCDILIAADVPDTKFGDLANQFSKSGQRVSIIGQIIASPFYKGFAENNQDLLSFARSAKKVYTTNAILHKVFQHYNIPMENTFEKLDTKTYRDLYGEICESINLL